MTAFGGTAASEGRATLPDVKESSRPSMLMTWLSLFTSSTTLFCCALPALFVALGSGAAFASLLGVFPWLTWFGENKAIVFPMAAVMLTLSGILRWKSRKAPCPADPKLRAACAGSRKVGGVIYWTSVAIFLVGSFFAFLAPVLLL
ncbi:MAG: hypothetical protein AAGJ79_05305 [Verrucomicrobiota bacterium]